MAWNQRPEHSSEPLPGTQGPYSVHSISEELHLPLSALRASIEAIARDLPPDNPQAERFEGVVSEVVRIGRRVQNLIDFSHPPPLQPRRGARCAHRTMQIQYVDSALLQQPSLARPIVNGNQ